MQAPATGKIANKK